jgi:hypothetical protein
MIFESDEREGGRGEREYGETPDESVLAGMVPAT